PPLIMSRCAASGRGGYGGEKNITGRFAEKSETMDQPIWLQAGNKQKIERRKRNGNQSLRGQAQTGAQGRLHRSAQRLFIRVAGEIPRRGHSSDQTVSAGRAAFYVCRGRQLRIGARRAVRRPTRSNVARARRIDEISRFPAAGGNFQA